MARISRNGTARRAGITFLSAALASLLLLDGGIVLARGGSTGRRPGGAVPGRPDTPQVSDDPVLRERRNRNRDLPRRNPSSSAAPPPPTTPRPAPTPQAGSLVHLHHGSVRIGAGLARVQLTLEVQNVGPQVMEWERTYALDPHAEVIGAVLKRDGEDPITARTLTEADARRIYTQIRTPRQRTPLQDPLLVSRPKDDELAIRIWPIAPQETIRVELTFVTPLRGHGAKRTYRDVMGGPMREKITPTKRPSRERELRDLPGTIVGAKANWLFQTGSLVLANDTADGMAFSGARGDRLLFTGNAATDKDTPAPQVGFLSRERSPVAQLVGSGTFAGRIATWRFDPKTFLAKRGYALTPGLTLKLVPRRGSCNRLVPNRFAPTDMPLPVTARVSSRTAEHVRYTVILLSQDGEELERFAQTLRLERKRLDKELEGAVAGWHRACLVERVQKWAGMDPKRQREAQKFAVDVGVLARGTSALAVPRAERQRMSPANRRLYDNDGVPLGAQKHEADFRAPPHRSLDD